MSTRVLCFAHLLVGAICVLVAALLTGFGHGSDLAAGLFGAGAALFPTAPSGLLNRTGGTLVQDTVSAVKAGANIAAGPVATTIPPGGSA